MYYNTVEIKPDRGNDCKTWSVCFSALPFDREPGNYHPSSLGFMHYPRKWGKQKGFDTLKSHMIAEHEKKIEELTKSLAQLKKLEPK